MIPTDWFIFFTGVETTKQCQAMVVKWLFNYRLDRIHGGLHDRHRFVLRIWYSKPIILDFCIDKTMIKLSSYFPYMANTTMYIHNIDNMGFENISITTINHTIINHHKITKSYKKPYCHHIISPIDQTALPRFSNKAIFGTTEGIEERKVPDTRGGWEVQKGYHLVN